MKIQNNFFFFWWGGCRGERSGGEGPGRGGQGGCERRTEVFVKIQKKFFFFFFWGGGGGGVGLGGVRVDVNQELKFFGKSKKKIGGGGRVGPWGGSGLGVQDGCERRIEVFVKIQKNIFFLGGGGGSVGVGLGGQSGCEQ